LNLYLKMPQMTAMEWKVGLPIHLTQDYDPLVLTPPQSPRDPGLSTFVHRLSGGRNSSNENSVPGQCDSQAACFSEDCAVCGQPPYFHIPAKSKAETHSTQFPSSPCPSLTHRPSRALHGVESWGGKVKCSRPEGTVHGSQAVLRAVMM
jgi:hypothetical protein